MVAGQKLALCNGAKAGTSIAARAVPASTAAAEGRTGLRQTLRHLIMVVLVASGLVMGVCAMLVLLAYSAFDAFVTMSWTIRNGRRHACHANHH